MSAVLLLMAIAAAAVTLRVQSPLTAARVEDVVGRLHQADSHTRVACREQGRPLKLVLDTVNGRVFRAEVDNKPLATLLELPEGTRIEKVLSAVGEIASGQASIYFTAQGLTPSYAVGLDSGGRKDWILLAGLTGQLVQVKDEVEARAILGLASRRNAG